MIELFITYDSLDVDLVEETLSGCDADQVFLLKDGDSWQVQVSPSVRRMKISPSVVRLYNMDGRLFVKEVDNIFEVYTELPEP